MHKRAIKHIETNKLLIAVFRENNNFDLCGNQTTKNLSMLICITTTAELNEENWNKFMKKIQVMLLVALTSRPKT